MPLALKLVWGEAAAQEVDGRHARGFVYEIIRGIDPEIHDDNAPKSFSLALGADHLRINTLTDDLDRSLSSACRELVGSTIRLGTLRLRVREVRMEGHPTTGATTYAQFLRAPAQRETIFHLASPTFFRRAESNYLLPEPDLFYSSLISRWDSFAPIPVPPSVADVLTRSELREYAIRTVPVSYEAHAHGFLGHLTYRLPRASEEAFRWAQALAQFAYFSGVGAKTTMGLGAVQPHTEPR